METKEWRFEDKSSWGPGPWQSEPDKVQWRDEATGALCGYVGVPPSHPAFGKFYDDVDVEVHGGLTFADKCHESDDEGRGICHVTEPGEPDVWWLGFDCAHFMDVSPAMDARSASIGLFRFPTSSLGNEPGTPGSSYKGVAYVRGEVTELARQLAAVA